MARGGARPGAGRPKGAASKLDEEARRKAAAEGVSPLDFLLDVMRDSDHAPSVRLDAAKAAAPYMHAKLANIQVQGEVDGIMTIRWDTGKAPDA